MTEQRPTWENQVIEAIRKFASDYSIVYAKKDRELSAHFEIGCFLSLIQFYERLNFVGSVMNPDQGNGSYNYLTSPTGNPDNFSFMKMTKKKEIIEIRQQVRIVSHVGENIAFTPDIVVLPADTEIRKKKDSDYAGGKRHLFHVNSKNVIAAHECKSLLPFPELLVSFLGTLIAAHAWLEDINYDKIIDVHGNHLAPCLFVGGTARALHLKMIKGLKDAYPLNIVVGMHSGTWDLLGQNADIRRIRNPFKPKSLSKRNRLTKKSKRRIPFP
jgi:hypothetical protein